ncbi:Transcription factor hho2 [Thalictrum thalictroides]|uniref:Transcription factor hho2 n=1 Tax=Thalictrum thalictroides TaxID=46969 RepID=A0A7J6WYG2_THATH|nr:Transcription factor hho2 [Thalictrum thalictroides]
MDFLGKMTKGGIRCEEYMEALEEERHKIQVFHRELPLCLELVTQAIDICKKQVGIKHECQDVELISSIETRKLYSPKEQKVDWLKSAQLWSQDFSDQKDKPSQKTIGIDSNRTKGAFRPFSRDEGLRASAATSTSTTAETVNVSSVNTNRGEEKQRQVESHKKARRSWSNELHKKFLRALQQLGGSHAATPKQIRELMKVDGLTNDEVKSHLQKYRLHTRRTSAAIHIKGNPQSPQLILMGGLLVQPEESFHERPTTGDAAQLVTNGVYARAQSPLLTSQQQQKQSSTVQPESKSRSSQAEHCISMEDEDTHSDHRSSSSSTQSTTVSVSLA